MKRSVVSVFICVIALLSPSFVLGQFGMGCCPAGMAGMSCVTVGNVKVVPWLGFGYQSLGLNINFPFSGTQNAFFQNLDVRLKNNALWVGSLGLDVALRQRFRFFGAAGTNLFVSNAGSLGTDTLVRGFGFGRGALDWSGTQVRWWELNLGGLYCLTDDVAILVGYKCDSLSQKPELGGEAASFQVFEEITLTGTQDYSSDFKAITRSPYIGIKICQSYLDFSLVWSPWLTSYDVKIPLRVIDTLSFRRIFASQSVDSRYQLSGGGGNLLEAFAQTKLNIREHLGVNLWLKGSWLQCKGNGNLDQDGQLFFGLQTIDRSASGSGNSSFTRYLWALGISGQLMF